MIAESDFSGSSGVSKAWKEARKKMLTSPLRVDTLRKFAKTLRVAEVILD
jgi:hypothetical protein